MSQTFGFKQFRVQQGDSAFKVGTDSVLLGAWANVSDAHNILDAGTGTGILALMAAQKNPLANITGIDTDQISIQIAADNFAASKWANRLQAVHTDLLQFAPLHQGYYDHIISNPPYFSNGLLPGDSRVAAARHQKNGWESWVGAVVKALHPQGRWTVVIPVSEMKSIILEAALAGLHVCRETSVCSRKGLPAIRYLLEFTTNPMAGRTREHLNIYTQEEEYSPGYRELTKEFYLFF